jgi:arylsulfatase A-like enzyme
MGKNLPVSITIDTMNLAVGVSQDEPAHNKPHAKSAGADSMRILSTQGFSNVPKKKISKLQYLAASLLVAGACGSAPTPTKETTKTAPVNVDGQSGAEQAKPREPKDEHPIFSLVDNRLLAHAHRGGALITMPGLPAFAKYMRVAKGRTWKPNQTADDKRVGAPDTYASFELPLTAEQAKDANMLYVRIKSTGAKLIDVKIAGNKIGTINLNQGWQTAQLAIPSGTLKHGENSFQFIFNTAGKAVVEWIQIGGTPEENAPKVFDASKRALVFGKDEGFSYYVKVPKASRLIGDVEGDANCEILVNAETSDGQKVDGKLKGKGAVDLASIEGKIARVTLTGAGCEESLLTSPSLTVAGPEPKVDKSKKPTNVIFWVMDSLRADRLKPNNPEARPEVPNFEKLSKEAAYFKYSYSQGNESRASHASMWSSQFPSNHGMIKDGAKLADTWTTIDEVTKNAGFYNVGVSSNGYITSRWGFGTKWDSYRNHIHDGGGLRGQNILDFSIKNLEKKTDKPFFLYMGMIDTHVSWEAREPWFSKYDPEPYNGKYTKRLSGIDADAYASGKTSFTERDKKRIVAMYDSCVSYQDDLIAKVFEQLKAWSVDQNTMIIITADHGDEQWEDGRLGHGSSQKETLIRVPFIVYYPPLIPGGIIEEGADAGVDVVPTIADAIGAPIPADAQGESIIPLAQGVGRGYPRPTFSSQYELAYSISMAGLKLRATGSSITLYDADKDLLEKTNLVETKPMELRFMTDTMATFLAYQKQWKKWKWGVASNALPAFADEVESK